MCELNSRNVSSIRKELRMKLITQRIMMAAAALSLLALIAGCGARFTNPSTETFTVYQDAPKMSLLDLGAPGNTLVKMPSDANPNLERRATLMFFTFANGKDQIVAFGAADYSPSAPEFEAGQAVVRPVLGGTRKYMGARGQVTST